MEKFCWGVAAESFSQDGSWHYFRRAILLDLILISWWISQVGKRKPVWMQWSFSNIPKNMLRIFQRTSSDHSWLILQTIPSCGCPEDSARHAFEASKRPAFFGQERPWNPYCWQVLSINEQSGMLQKIPNMFSCLKHLVVTAAKTIQRAMVTTSQLDLAIRRLVWLGCPMVPCFIFIFYSCSG